MPTILRPHEFADVLCCPPPCNGKLFAHDGSFRCHGCGKMYPVRDRILELIDAACLDSEKARELQGNSFDISDEKVVAHMAAKDLWSGFYAFFHLQKIQKLLRHMDGEGIRSFAALGTGCGLEIKMILQHRGLDEVLCSDLSWSSLQVVPHSVADFPIRIGMFTSDLDACPIADTSIPLIIYEALHHVSDMHAALERYLQKGFRNIFLVEPTKTQLCGY